MTTRRDFLKETLGSGAALAFAVSVTRSSTAAALQVDATAKAFRSKINGGVLLPEDSAYEAARRVAFWNPMTAKHPAMIVQCAGADDVARSIDFARRRGISVAVRSGGHSFLGWGTCDHGLVIDLSRLKTIAIDPVNRVARTGAGAVAHDVVSAAGRRGLAPVLGECPTVGVAGLTLGGGLGWLSGTHGAACDNLLSADLVSADSRQLTASARSNSDLFWAVRGGGGNFGVATSFEYRLHPIGPILAGGFTYRFRDARAVLRFYRDFMASAPDELQGVALFPNAATVLNVVLVYTGDPREGERIVTPLRHVASPLRDTMQRRAYADTFTMPPYGEGFLPVQFSSCKATYVAQLSDEAIDIALDRLSRAPEGCNLGFDHYMHGAVCHVPPNATAFELRKPNALHVWIGGGWSNSAAAAPAMTWVNETWKRLQPFSGGRIYSNYQSTEGESAVKAVFGDNYARLAALKKKYDPANIFQLNQNVRPLA